MLTREATENGSLVYTLGFLLYAYVRALYSGVPFWRWRDSHFRNPKTGGINWTNLIGVSAYVLITIAAGYAVVFTFKFATDGNINQGIITTLFGLSAIFSAILAYVVFGEKLKVSHVSLNIPHLT